IHPVGRKFKTLTKFVARTSSRKFFYISILHFLHVFYDDLCSCSILGITSSSLFLDTFVQWQHPPTQLSLALALWCDKRPLDRPSIACPYTCLSIVSVQGSISRSTQI